MSKAVIVVEAGEKSGSLDTASKARRQGRPVYAMPGSPGTDELIAGGAKFLPENADPDELCHRILHAGGEADSQLDLFGDP